MIAKRLQFFTFGLIWGQYKHPTIILQTWNCLPAKTSAVYVNERTVQSNNNSLQIRAENIKTYKAFKKKKNSFYFKLTKDFPLVNNCLFLSKHCLNNKISILHEITQKHWSTTHNSIWVYDSKIRPLVLTWRESKAKEWLHINVLLTVTCFFFFFFFFVPLMPQQLDSARQQLTWHLCDTSIQIQRGRFVSGRGWAEKKT